MRNPFLQPGSPLVTIERRRQERFQIAVYATLVGTTFLLLAFLIQGCRAEMKTTGNATPSSQSTAVSTK